MLSDNQRSFYVFIVLFMASNLCFSGRKEDSAQRGQAKPLNFSQVFDNAERQLVLDGGGAAHFDLRPGPGGGGPASAMNVLCLIETLPPELIQHILSWLDWDSSEAFSRVSRTIRSAVLGLVRFVQGVGERPVPVQELGLLENRDPMFAPTLGGLDFAFYDQDLPALEQFLSVIQRTVRDEFSVPQTRNLSVKIDRIEDADKVIRLLLSQPYLQDVALFLDTDLTEKQVVLLSRALQSLKRMRSLKLRFKLQKSSIRLLLTLPQLTQVRDLEVSFSELNFSLNEMSEVLRLLSQMPQLRRLKLSFGGMDSDNDFLEMLGTALKELNELTCLEIELPKLVGIVNMHHFVVAMQGLIQLQKLVLTRTEYRQFLTYEDYVLLTKSIGDMVHLRSFEWDMGYLRVRTQDGESLHNVSWAVKQLLSDLKRATALEELTLYVPNYDLLNLAIIDFLTSTKDRLRKFILNCPHATISIGHMHELSGVLRQMERLEVLGICAKAKYLTSYAFLELVNACNKINKLQSLSLDLQGFCSGVYSGWLRAFTVDDVAGSLFNLKRLELDLTNGMMTHKSLKDLGRMVSRMEQVHTVMIALGSVEHIVYTLREDPFKVFFRGLSQLPSLTDLSLKLERDRMTPKLFESLCRGLQTMPRIRRVALYFDKGFTDVPFARLLESVKRSQSLEELKIEFRSVPNRVEINSLKRLVLDLRKQITKKRLRVSVVGPQNAYFECVNQMLTERCEGSGVHFEADACDEYF